MTTAAPPRRRLSLIELRVVAGLARGGDDVSIGRRLGLSRFTVSGHVERACAATGIGGWGRRAALVDHAYRQGLLDGLASETRIRPRLSVREAQVLEGIARGLSNAEIGRELFCRRGRALSEDTIRSHAHDLLGQLGARNRAHAVALGWQQQLLGAAVRRGRQS